jgi:hypothetical protein
MDLLPTFMDLFALSRPEGGRPLHGISLVPLLREPGFVPAERVVVVDTQRQAELKKWRLACVMKDEMAGGEIVHKWRLNRGSASSPVELYDFAVDRAEEQNVAEKHPDVVAELVAAYEAWWADVSQGKDAFPPFVVNSEKEDELTLFSHSWIGADQSPWHQNHVKSAEPGTRTLPVRFDRPGRYRFELRRWPREDGGAIDGPSKSGGGKVLPVKKASLDLAGVGAMARSVHAGDAMAVFEMDVPAGPATQLKTAFLGADGEVLAGAYYVYIRPVNAP